MWIPALPAFAGRAAPVPVPPASAAPARWLLSGPVVSSTQTPQAVWSISDALKLALKNNPNLRAARTNYEAAQAALDESYGVYLPTLDVSAQAERSTLPAPSAGLSGILGQNNPYADGMAEVRQTLFDFGKGLERIRAAKSGLLSARERYLALRNLIKLSTERSFYNVASAEKMVEVAKKGLAKYEETYRDTNLYVKTGVRPAFDLTQSEVQLSRAQLNLISAKNALDLARIALLNIMGMTRQVRFTIKEPAMQTFDVRAESMRLSDLTAEALMARPEMRAAKAEISASRALLQEERLEYFPTFSADAWSGRFLPDYPSSLRTAYAFGVGATWNLFDGWQTASRVRELRARLGSEKALFNAEAEQVVAEVASAYMNLVRAEQSERVAQNSLFFAKENLNYAQLRYTNGVGTMLELLTAETSLVNAQADFVQTLYRRAIAVASLRQAVNVPLKGEK